MGRVESAPVNLGAKEGTPPASGDRRDKPRLRKREGWGWHCNHGRSTGSEHDRKFPMISTSVIIVAAAAATSMVLTAAVRAAALRIGLTDRPDGHRKLHGDATPLGGGLAVLLASCAVLAVLTLLPSPWDFGLRGEATELLPMLAAASTIVAVGLVDDRFRLRGRHKLIGQIAAASILIASGTVIQVIVVFGWRIELGLLSVPFTLFWLVGATNAINLLDGIDGLAAMLGVILSLTIAAMAAATGHGTAAVVALVLGGSLLGFLQFNFPPARVFLGDAGSMLIGLVVGALAIDAALKGPGTVLLAAPLAIWTIPVLDSVAAIIRRKLTGRSIYMTDRDHLHHRLLSSLGSSQRVLAWVGVCCAATCVAALLSVSLKSDLLALLTGPAIVVILAVSGVFGRGEMVLLFDRLKSVGISLLHPLVTRDAAVRETAVRLQGSGDWDLLWTTLTESADRLHLVRIRLDVNLPLAQESYSAAWERTLADGADRCWKVDIPLLLTGQPIARLTVVGERNGESSCSAIDLLMDMLVPFEERICSLADDYSALGTLSLARNGRNGRASRRAAGLGAAGERSEGRRRRRVCFLNRSYWPDAEATGQLLTELAEDLAAAYDVTVIAGQPNQNPDGAEYRRCGRELRNGVTVRRVRHTRWDKRSLVGRAVNLATYLAGALVVAWRTERPDVIVVETDPPLLCLLGWLLRRRHGARLVVYLQDLYPDIALALGKLHEGMLVRCLRRAMYAAYRRADRVVVLSRDMQSRVLEIGVAPEKVVRLPNWVDTAAIHPRKTGNEFRREHGFDGRFVVMYSGNLGLCQRLEDIIEAARLLKDRAEILFLLVGDGASRARLERQARELGLDNVRFLPYQSKGRLSESLSAADLHLVPLDQRVASCLMPSKLYGVLASGTAAMVIAPEGTELADVAAEGVGFVVAPEQPHALADAVRWAADHRVELEEMGRRARVLAEGQYDRRRLTAAFGEMLDEVDGATLPLPVFAGSAALVKNEC